MADGVVEAGDPVPENCQEIVTLQETLDETTQPDTRTGKQKKDEQELEESGGEVSEEAVHQTSSQPQVKTQKIQQEEVAGAIVDLSGLRPKYHARARPTMKNILVEYGLKHADGDKFKTKRPSSRRMQREGSFLDASELEKRRAKQEHYLQVYEGVHRLRDLYYKHYMHALRRKITLQKEEIRRKDEEMMTKIKQKEKMETQECSNLKMSMKRHAFKHDDEYLKKVPKTNFYKIVELVDRMKRSGKLKTPSEMDAFWDNIQKPEVFQIYFPLSPKSISTVKESVLGAPVGTLTSLAHNKRPMTQIKETRESRPSTDDLPSVSWAVTHQATHIHKEPPSPEQPTDPAVIARLAALDLEKRLGTKPLPKLHCFTMDLAGDKQDTEEILKQLEAKKREQDRRVRVRKVRHMYELALSNKATSKRILEKQDELINPLDSTTIKDLTSNLDLVLACDPDEEEVEEDSRPWTRYLRQAIVPIEQGVHSPDTAALMPVTKGPSVKTKRKREGLKALPAPPPAPPALTLDNVIGDAKIMEARCVSTLWSNYIPGGNTETVSTAVE